MVRIRYEIKLPLPQINGELVPNPKLAMFGERDGLNFSFKLSKIIASFITFFRATYKQKHIFQTALTRVHWLAGAKFAAEFVCGRAYNNNNNNNFYLLIFKYKLG